MSVRRRPRTHPNDVTPASRAPHATPPHIAEHSPRNEEATEGPGVVVVVMVVVMEWGWVDVGVGVLGGWCCELPGYIIISLQMRAGLCPTALTAHTGHTMHAPRAADSLG